MRYQKNEKLTELIEGKRVVIVGPAQYLVRRGLGQTIDEYDTVCRTNYMSPVKFKEDYGSRTDIMFYNCSTASLGQMKEHMEKHPDFGEKMKLVACPVVKVLGPEKWTEWGKDYISKTVSNFDSINVYGTDFYWIGMNNYRCLFDKVGCREPNSGLLSILMILEHNPKELFITGFTFYMDGKNTYFNGYATKAPNWKGKSGHPQEPQKEFFKNYVLSQPGVKIDSHLRKLLKVRHNNIQKV